MDQRNLTEWLTIIIVSFIQCMQICIKQWKLDCAVAHNQAHKTHHFFWCGESVTLIFDPWRRYFIAEFL